MWQGSQKRFMSCRDWRKFRGIGGQINKLCESVSGYPQTGPGRLDCFVNSSDNEESFSPSSGSKL